MLLTSSAEGGSSWSINSSPLPDSLSDVQSDRESDRVVPAASTHQSIEHDREDQHKDAVVSAGINPGANTAATPSALYATEAEPLTPRAQQQKARLQPTLRDSEVDGLYALRQAAGLKALQRSRIGLRSTGTLARFAETNPTVASAFVSFAEPLSPLRERDFVALSDLFLRDDMYAIEVDIKQRLLLLLPEPCWEDHVFDFLKEFL